MLPRAWTTRAWKTAAERTGSRHHRPLSPMRCGPTAGPKGSGAELGSLQLTGSSAFTCRNTGPWSFVGGEACTPKLPADERWERAASAVMPLLQEVPQHVMMITVPGQGETVHHIDTKAKLDSEWLPRFNLALKEFGMVAHVVVYMPSCQCKGQREVITCATRLMLYLADDVPSSKQMKDHEGLSVEHKTISDRFFGPKHFAPHPQQMKR